MVRIDDSAIGGVLRLAGARLAGEANQVLLASGLTAAAVDCGKGLSTGRHRADLAARAGIRCSPAGGTYLVVAGFTAFGWLLSIALIPAITRTLSQADR